MNNLARMLKRYARNTKGIRLEMKFSFWDNRGYQEIKD